LGSSLFSWIVDISIVDSVVSVKNVLNFTLTIGISESIVMLLPVIVIGNLAIPFVTIGAVYVADIPVSAVILVTSRRSLSKVRSKVTLSSPLS
jgi:hypothetical protein